MIWLLGALFIPGIILSVSNSSYFPWLNLFGILMVGLAGLIACNKTA